MNTTPWQNVGAATELFVGFALVMATLVMLWGLTALLGRVVVRVEAHRARRAADGKAAAQAVDDDETLAVIAAAAAAVLDAPHRVVSVRPRQSVWGQLGRQDLHASHNVR